MSVPFVFLSVTKEITIFLGREEVEFFKAGGLKESRGCVRLVRLADYSFLISLQTFCIKAESLSPAA